MTNTVNEKEVHENVKELVQTSWEFQIKDKVGMNTNVHKSSYNQKSSYLKSTGKNVCIIVSNNNLDKTTQIISILQMRKIIKRYLDISLNKTTIRMMKILGRYQNSK